MSFSLIYLLQRFFYRIFDFVRNWYLGGFRVVVHQTLNILEGLDRRLAIRITLRHLFKPLYQDYTLIGYIIGFFFRSIRLFFGSIVYFLVILIAIGIYVAWAVAPIYLFYEALYGKRL